ncbi:heme ABC exporter ATP-binding protein CcmA [Brevundimonas sp.]|uniref:heme ABC exporter ATP-binding protein CcmA n=1 Tax=Brevundimonas sp. TaxID=1871086 RepID=UPI001D2D3392|nr:heme ABC exporter ATP-binding protein CcmA [Brevundimonas sp.]MBL0948215.1 heme ABC exporter ATP-binding protein CcmA [Brevundimonas sp.]
MDIESGSQTGGGAVITLVLDGVSVWRGERRLFEGLDLTVRPGEAVALTGANGAGKSSLLRAIAGLLTPEAGIVRFERDGQNLDPEVARTRHLHLIGHQDGFRSGRTARDELAFQVGWCGGDTAALSGAVQALGLEGLMDLEVRRLSAGQRRRLALARLLAAPRPVWLLDEPLSPLDARWRARLGQLMQAHLDGGGILLAAVHDPLPIPACSFAVGEVA